MRLLLIATSGGDHLDGGVENNGLYNCVWRGLRYPDTPERFNGRAREVFLEFLKPSLDVVVPFNSIADKQNSLGGHFVSPRGCGFWPRPKAGSLPGPSWRDW